MTTASNEPERPPAARLARNALTGAPRYGIGALLALAVTPYALGVLGKERFGLWAVAGALLAVLRLVDLGTTRALVRAVSRSADLGGRRTAAELGTARVLLASIAILCVVAVWLAADRLALRIFAVPPGLLADARVVMIGTSVVAAIETLFAPWSATVEGLGRLDRVNLIDTWQRIASSLGVVVVLGLGWGLAGLVAKNALTTLGAGLAYRLAARRMAPDLARAPMQLDADAARDLFSFGRHVQASNLSVAMVEPVLKAILSHSSGLAALAGFELAMRITTLVGSVLVAMGQAVFPALAGAMAQAPDAPDDRVRRLYAASTRYLAWIAVPACGLMGLLSTPFVTAWLGAGYGDVAWGIGVLCAGWLAAILGLPAFLTLQAGGAVNRSTLSALVTMTTSVGLGLVLAAPWGLRGILLATAAGMLAGALFNAWAVARLLGWSATLAFADPRLWLAALAGGAAAWWIAGQVPYRAGLLGVAQVALTAAAGAAVYGLALAASGALGAREWRLMRGALLSPKTAPGDGIAGTGP